MRGEAGEEALEHQDGDEKGWDGGKTGLEIVHFG